MMIKVKSESEKESRRDHSAWAQQNQSHEPKHLEPLILLILNYRGKGKVICIRQRRITKRAVIISVL